MKGLKGIIQATDYHTGGQPVRVLTGGLPPIHGRTMREKADYVKQHLDWVRTAVVHEPRGHKDMFAVILTEPNRPSECLHAPRARAAKITTSWVTCAHTPALASPLHAGTQLDENRCMSHS